MKKRLQLIAILPLVKVKARATNDESWEPWPPQVLIRALLTALIVAGIAAVSCLTYPMSDEVAFIVAKSFILTLLVTLATELGLKWKEG